MASLATANLPSDDEEDEDYQPQAPNKEEAKPTEEERSTKRGLQDQDETAGDGVGVVESSYEQQRKKAKREDVARIWEQMNERLVTNVSGKRNFAVSSLCREIKGKTDPDKFWKSCLGVKSSIGDAGKHQPAAAIKSAKALPPSKTKDFAKSALAAAKDAISVALPQMHGKVAVMETRVFGGKTIEVEKIVDAGSQPEKTMGTKGFDAFLETLDGKKKVNVLDKSRSDWKDHKKANSSLDEELEIHKKSNDQYLDKANFLQRATLKEYESDLNKRLASDVRTRGRL